MFVRTMIVRWYFLMESMIPPSDADVEDREPATVSPCRQIPQRRLENPACHPFEGDVHFFRRVVGTGGDFRLDAIHQVKSDLR